uniref:Uncharacterized protein n=1 Tax=Rhizophora mucronata TaxID=61149 RepID=A0A2P2PQL8_RHIMU
MLKHLALLQLLQETLELELEMGSRFGLPNFLIF